MAGITSYYIPVFISIATPLYNNNNFIFTYIFWQ